MADGKVVKLETLETLVGKKFSLTKTERLETRAALAKFDLDRALIEEAQASFLASRSEKVLARNGVSIEGAGRIPVAHRIVDGAVVEIMIVPDPTAPDEAPPSPAVPSQAPSPAPAPLDALAMSIAE